MLNNLKPLIQQLKQTSQKHQIPAEIQNIIDQLFNLSDEKGNQQQQGLNLSFPPMTELDDHLQKFKQAAGQLDSQEIQQYTQVSIESFEILKIIIQFSQNSKKLTQDQIKEIQKLLQQKTLPFSKFHLDYNYHSKMIQDGINSVFWVFSDVPKLAVEGQIESAEFNGLKLKQKKIQQLTDWATHFLNAVKSQKQYVISNYPTGLQWNFKGEAQFQTLIQALKGEIKLEQKQQQTANNQQQQQQQQQPQQNNQEDTYPPMDELDKNLQALVQAGSALEPELQELTDLIKKAFEGMKVVLHYSKKLKKVPEKVTQLQKNFQDQVFKPLNKAKAAVKFGDHYKTVCQGINAVCWIFSDTPKMVIDGAIESSEFYGNKVLLQKKAEHTNWYNQFKLSLKSLLPYVQTNYSTGLIWNFKGQQEYDELFQVLKGEKPLNQSSPTKQQQDPTPDIPAPPMFAPPPPPPPNFEALTKNIKLDFKDEPVVAQDSRAALFAQLNVGEDAIKSHLKHVKKGEKYDGKKNDQTSQQQTQNKGQVQKQIKKEPKKYQKDNWFVENFSKEKIEFNAQDIQIKQSLFVENCDNCAIILSTKELVSGVELVDCQSCEIYVKQKSPSIQIDKSDTVRVTFMKDRNCDVVTSKSSGVNLTFALNEEGDYEKDTSIPESFITKWNNELNRFVTTQLDTFA